MARRNTGSREGKVKKVNQYKKDELVHLEKQMKAANQTESLRYKHVKTRIDAIESVLVSD